MMGKSHIGPLWPWDADEKGFLFVTISEDEGSL